MIGKIGPSVRGKLIRKAHLALHPAGGAIGGAVAGGLLGSIGALVLPAGLHNAGVLTVLLLAGALFDIGLAPGLTLWSRQTPGSWACSLGPVNATFAWGVDLGALVLTRAPLAAAYALPAYCVLQRDPLVGALVLATYGVVKTGFVAALLAATSTDPGRMTTVIVRRHNAVRNLGVAVTLAAALVLTAAPAAEASLYFEFTPTAASPGQRVSGRTVGRGAFHPIPTEDQLPLLYVMSEGSSVDLGRLRVDSEGNARVQFEVPRLTPSTYTVFADCPTCRPTSSSLPVGEFRVLASEAENSPAAGSRPLWYIWTAAAMAVIAIGGTLILSRRRGAGVVTTKQRPSRSVGGDDG